MKSVIGEKSGKLALLIEQDGSSEAVISAALQSCIGSPCDIEIVANGREASSLLRRKTYDFVFADMDSLDDISCKEDEAVTRVCRLVCGGLLVVLTSQNSVSATVAAMQAGAHDCLAKPVAAQLLAGRLEELARRHRKTGALTCRRDDGQDAHNRENAVRVSPQMRLVAEQISRAAESVAPVFVIGESGTGKKTVAEAVHRESPRRSGSWAHFDCAAVSGNIMEIELFGVVKGAFTGADHDMVGAVERADGGTLFLSEIGEMDLGLQTKLLRFMQTGTFTRVGDAASHKADVRLICGSRRNPMQLIADRRFKEELFYHLHALPIHLPPLRQRTTDILPLARKFLERFSKEEHKAFQGISDDGADYLLGYGWPGNISELHDLIRRVVVLSPGGTVVAADLISAATLSAATISNSGKASAGANAALINTILPMWRQEQKIIEDAIVHFHGNIGLAAAALEISPSTIYRKRQSWEMQRTRVA